MAFLNRCETFRRVSVPQFVLTTRLKGHLPLSGGDMLRSPTERDARQGNLGTLNHRGTPKRPSAGPGRVRGKRSEAEYSEL